MIFSVFQKNWVFGYSWPPYCGIGATIRIGREMLCLPYAEFFLLLDAIFLTIRTLWHCNTRGGRGKINYQMKTVFVEQPLALPKSDKYIRANKTWMGPRVSVACVSSFCYCIHQRIRLYYVSPWNLYLKTVDMCSTAVFLNYLFSSWDRALECLRVCQK